MDGLITSSNLVELGREEEEEEKEGGGEGSAVLPGSRLVHLFY